MRVFWFAATLVILPLLFSTATLDPVLTVSFTALAVILAAALAWELARLHTSGAATEYAVLRRLVFPVALTYVLVVGASLTQAVNFSEGLFEFLRTALALTVLTLSTIVLTRSESALEILTRCGTVGCGLVAAIAVGQYAGLAFLTIPGNVIPYATLANKDLLASFLCLALPFPVLSHLREHGPWRWFGGIVTALALFTVIASRTLSAWSALFMATLVGVILFRLRRAREAPGLGSSNLRFRTAAAAIAVALFALLLESGYIIPTHKPSIPARLESILRGADRSANERIALWRTSLKMTKDHPLLGVGAGNWKIAFPAYGTMGDLSPAGELLFQRPHNDYLWVAAEAGLIGMILYLGLFGQVLFYGLRVVRSSNSMNEVTLVVGLVCGIICYMTDSFFSFPKERITHLAYLMVAASAVIAVYSRNAPRGRPPSRKVITLVLVIALVFAIGSAWIGLLHIRSEVHTRTALAANAAGDWAAVVHEIGQARSEFATLDPTGTPLAWYRGVAAYNLGDRAAACECFRQAYRDNPNHLHVLNNLATCREQQGDHAGAIALYDSALQISPTFQETLINLTAVYYNLGRYEQADTILSRVVNYPDSARVAEFKRRLAAKLHKAGE